ncbi:MAG: hypothetical protein D6767_04355 [Candidatus Hydrogenedentota bacterium]|nr:MAG: hypothetical protein D6767_04355 [Candidatus Hydrogenedentota bacterium]
MLQENQIQLLKAVALAYKEGMHAPIVKAVSRGEAAKRLVDLAKKEGIPIVQNEAEELLDALEALPIHSEIPPELYVSIAQIFAFLHDFNLKNGRK